MYILGGFLYVGNKSTITVNKYYAVNVEKFFSCFTIEHSYEFEYKTTTKYSFLDDTITIYPLLYASASANNLITKSKNKRLSKRMKKSYKLKYNFYKRNRKRKYFIYHYSSRILLFCKYFFKTVRYDKVIALKRRRYKFFRRRKKIIMKFPLQFIRAARIPVLSTFYPLRKYKSKKKIKKYKYLNYTKKSKVSFKLIPTYPYNYLRTFISEPIKLNSSYFNYATYIKLNPLFFMNFKLHSKLYFNSLILVYYFQSLLNTLISLNYKYYRNTYLNSRQPYSFRFIKRKKFFHLKRATLFDLYKIIITLYKTADIELFKAWVQRAFRIVSFKRHKFLCYVIRFYLKRLFLVYRRYTLCYGLFFRVKGKIAVGGNSRKRTFTVKLGKRSFTQKDLKLYYSDFFLLSQTGILGVKFLFSFR